MPVNNWSYEEKKKKVVIRGAEETFKEGNNQLEFLPKDKNLTWSSWAFTSLPALLFSCQPVYLHYMHTSGFQDRKSVFAYTEGDQ